MKTQSTKWVAGTVAVAVLLGVAGWFLLIGPQRAAAADLRAQTASQDQQNQLTQVRTQQLRADYASLPLRTSQLSQIRRQLPQQANMPGLIRDISRFATSSGVSITSVTPGATSALGASSSSLSTAPASGGVQQTDVTFVTSGHFSDQTLFLQHLQRDWSRAVLVQSVGMVPQQDGGKSGATLTMTVQARLFVMPTDDAATAAAQPATTGAATGAGSAPVAGSAPSGAVSSVPTSGASASAN